MESRDNGEDIRQEWDLNNRNDPKPTEVKGQLSINFKRYEIRTKESKKIGQKRHENIPERISEDKKIQHT